MKLEEEFMENGRKKVIMKETILSNFAGKYEEEEGQNASNNRRIQKPIMMIMQK